MSRFLAAAAAVIVVIIIIAVWRAGPGGSDPSSAGLTTDEAAEIAPVPVARGEGGDADDVVMVEKPVSDNRVLGATVAFTMADIVDEELNSGLGWRPNDLFLIGPGWWTDNINHVQLGKLEVARQSCRILKTRMARNDDADVFDTRLEQAESALFNDPTRYMLPSAEKKYREGVKAIRAYGEALDGGDAVFRARSNNLYDLLGYYKDVLGSCHSTLVRERESDGSTVSTFKADDYFYYSKGVADAVARMGRAIERDFKEEVTARSLKPLLNQALLVLEKGATLEPWVVTNGAADGLLANHRLNMSGYIADARQKLHAVRETLVK